MNLIQIFVGQERDVWVDPARVLWYAVNTNLAETAEACTVMFVDGQAWQFYDDVNTPPRLLTVETKP